jgi:hypothetical protein
MRSPVSPWERRPRRDCPSRGPAARPRRGGGAAPTGEAVGRLRRAGHHARTLLRACARRNPTSFCEREYACQKRQVRELIDDLRGKLLHHCGGRPKA